MLLQYVNIYIILYLYLYKSSLSRMGIQIDRLKSDKVFPLIEWIKTALSGRRRETNSIFIYVCRKIWKEFEA